MSIERAPDDRARLRWSRPFARIGRVRLVIFAAILIFPAMLWYRAAVAERDVDAGRLLVAEGVVVGLFEREYSGHAGATVRCPVVAFDSRDGRRWQYHHRHCPKGRGRNRFRVGDRIGMLYDVRDPSRAVVDPRGPWAFWAFVATAFVVAGGMLAPALEDRWRAARGARTAARAARARASGMRVRAVVADVRCDSAPVKGRFPWRVHARWEDPSTGVVHRFKSEPFGSSPSGRVGRTIDVWFDPDDPRVHWVDIGALSGEG